MKIIKISHMACLAVLFAFTFGSQAFASAGLPRIDGGFIAPESQASIPFLLADKGKSAETEKGEGMGKGKGSEMGKGEGLDKPKGEGSGSDEEHGKEGKDGHDDSHGKKDH